MSEIPKSNEKNREFYIALMFFIILVLTNFDYFLIQETFNVSGGLFLLIILNPLVLLFMFLFEPFLYVIDNYLMNPLGIWFAAFVQYLILVPLLFLFIRKAARLFRENKGIFAVGILLIPVILFLLFVGWTYGELFSHSYDGGK